MSKHTNGPLLQSGTIKVEKQMNKHYSSIVMEETFLSRSELKKLLFNLQGSDVVVTIMFNDVGSQQDNSG